MGKDQTLINALFLLFPERVIAIWHRDPEAPAHAGVLPFFDSGYLGACGTEWYYYPFWLSGRNVREELRNIWVNRTSWANWHWWRERQRCRLTGVLGMKELQKTFWNNLGPTCENCNGFMTFLLFTKLWCTLGLILPGSRTYLASSS